MAPISIGEGTKLAAVDEGFKALGDALIIRSAAPWRVADIISQRRGFLGIGLQRADDINPVERMQMIKMDNMIMLVLGTVHEIANDAGIFRYLYANRVVDCPHRGQSMDVRSDTA